MENIKTIAWRCLETYNITKLDFDVSKIIVEYFPTLYLVSIFKI